MFALVKDDKIEKIFTRPVGIMIDKINIQKKFLPYGLMKKEKILVSMKLLLILQIKKMNHTI